MSWCSKQDARPHTHRAHPHTRSVEDKNLDRAGSVVCDSTGAATFSLAWVL